MSIKTLNETESFFTKVIAKFADIELAVQEAWMKKPNALEKALCVFLAGPSGVFFLQETFEAGLTPDGCNLVSDSLEKSGAFEMRIIEIPLGEYKTITGEVLLKGIKDKNPLGQRHAEAVLRRPDYISRELRDFTILFPGTVQKDCELRRCVPGLYFLTGSLSEDDDNGQWKMAFYCLSRDFNCNYRIAVLSDLSE